MLKLQEAKWWEQLSSLDLTIKQQEKKTDGFFYWLNYYKDRIDDTNKIYCILKYITQSLMKAQRKTIESVWRAAREENQAF